MASVIYDSGRADVAAGNITWGGAGTYKVMLADATYTPSTAHDHPNDVTASELTDASYSRKTLAGLSVVVASNRAECRANNVTWTALASSTVAFAIVYKHVADDTDGKLICCIDVADVTIDSGGGDYTIKWNAGSSSGAVYKV